MIRGFLSSGLLQGSIAGTAGNFRQNGTQLLVNRISRAFLARTARSLAQPYGRSSGKTYVIQRIGDVFGAVGYLVPRIDQGRRNVIEVGCIACRQAGMSRQDDTCDHCIAEIARTTLHFSQGHQGSRLLRGFGVERDNLLVNACQDLIESSAENLATFTAGHNLQTQSNLENRDRRCPQRRARLSIKPFDDLRAW